MTLDHPWGVLAVIVLWAIIALFVCGLCYAAKCADRKRRAFEESRKRGILLDVGGSVKGKR